MTAHTHPSMFAYRAALSDLLDPELEIDLELACAPSQALSSGAVCASPAKKSSRTPKAKQRDEAFFWEDALDEVQDQSVVEFVSEASVVRQARSEMFDW